MQACFILLIKELSLHSTIVRNWSSYGWKKVEFVHSGFESANGVLTVFVEISHDLIEVRREGAFPKK